MAELILTDEEKSAVSYADWDDAALGRAVKRVAMIIQDIRGDDALACTAGATLLVHRLSRTKAAAITFPLVGLVDGPGRSDDWEVEVRRIRRV